LTLLAERRSEDVLPGRDVEFLHWEGPPITNEFVTDPRSRLTYSYYGELRSRLFDESARTPLIRGLELQLAVRYDKQEDSFQRNEVLPGEEVFHSSFASTAYTAGAKISPLPWLMIRGGYATGEQPPAVSGLTEYDPSTSTNSSLTDPKRGDTPIGVDGEFQVMVGGNSELEASRASTMFVGIVLTPTGLDGPHFALDYSRIRRSGDAISFTDEHIFAHEDDWPDRVIREPLTDEDRALGYASGRVELLDVRLHNDAAVEVDAFDVRADWLLSMLGGRLRLYADASYHKNNLHKALFRPDVQWAGYLEGPLKRRANGGFDWSKGPLAIGANLQYYGSSLVFGRDVLSMPDDQSELIQGSARIPSQSYLDLYGRWRLSAQNLSPLDNLTLDFGIINALDKAPPRESTFVTLRGPSYSRYGDARQRRFELGISFHF
jgi:outer membrane receptor protein involved in Fe transport